MNLLGKGGFASVYRARCIKTSMEVAIKMVILFITLFDSSIILIISVKLSDKYREILFNHSEGFFFTVI